MSAAEALLELPLLMAQEPEVERPMVRPRARVAHADAPEFESFVVEDWQRWLGASC
jgi:hypothetical protein